MNLTNGRPQRNAQAHDILAVERESAPGQLAFAIAADAARVSYLTLEPDRNWTEIPGIVRSMSRGLLPELRTPSAKTLFTWRSATETCWAQLLSHAVVRAGAAFVLECRLPFSNSSKSIRQFRLPCE